jgi:hypothetical protein
MRINFGCHVSYRAQMLHFVQHDKPSLGVKEPGHTPPWGALSHLLPFVPPAATMAK